MAFLQANIYSNVLEMEVMIDVILPQSTKKKIRHAKPINGHRSPGALFVAWDERKS